MHSGKSPAPWSRYTPARRAWFVAVLALVLVINAADRQILTVLLEPIKHEFDVSDAQLGLLTGAASVLFYATLGLPVAWLADRWDRRRMLAIAVVVWSGMTALCGSAASFWQLALARAGVGAGEAGGGPPMQSLLADYYEPQGRARPFAALTLAGTVGSLAGLTAAGWVAQRYGWRTAFYVAGAPGLLVAIAVQWGLDEPRRIGSWGPLRNGEPIAATIRSLASNTSYVLILAASVVYGLVAFGALVFIPSFLVRTHGLTIAEAGARFGLIATAGAVIGTVGGGWLADRLARRGIAWLGWFPAIGMLLAWPIHIVAFLSASLPVCLTMLFSGALVLSAVIPSQTSAFHAVCGSPRRAMAVAVMGLCSTLLSGGLGPLFAGALSDAFLVRYGPAQGLRYALLMMLTWFLPAGLLMVRMAPRLARDAQP